MYASSTRILTTPSIKLWIAGLVAWNSPARNVGSSMNSTSIKPMLSTTEKPTSSDCSFSAGTCLLSHSSSLSGLAFSSSGK